MICPHCLSSEHTTLKRHWFGHVTVWWCGYCVTTIPTVRLVAS